MKGLLYKECKQNRLYLLLTAAAAVAAIFLPVALCFADEIEPMESFKLLLSEGETIRLLFLLLGFVAVGMMQGLTMMGDDTKKWALFTASNPKGVSGFVYTKYLLVFAMSGIMLIGCYSAEQAFSTLGYCVAGLDAMPIMSFAILLFYAQLLLRAVELPFLIRFGVRTGSMIKVITLVAAVILFILLTLFGLMDGFFIVLNDLISGQMNDALSLAISAMPFAAVGAYYLSYRISCKLYMKGAEYYVK